MISQEVGVRGCDRPERNATIGKEPELPGLVLGGDGNRAYVLRSDGGMGPAVVISAEDEVVDRVQLETVAVSARG